MQDGQVVASAIYRPIFSLWVAIRLWPLRALLMFCQFEMDGEMESSTKVSNLGDLFVVDQKCFSDIDCCNGYECGESYNCESAGIFVVLTDEDLATQELNSIVPVEVASDTTEYRAENVGTGNRLIRGSWLDIYAREYQSGWVNNNQRWTFETIEGAEDGFYYVKNSRYEVYMKMGEEVGNTYTWEVESSETIPDDDDSSYRWYVRDISDDGDGSVVEIYHTSDEHLTRYVLGTYDSDNEQNVELCYQEVAEDSAFAEYTKYCMGTDEELSWYLI